MKKTRTLFLVLLGLIIGFLGSPAHAAKMTKRELRQFMGLYEFRTRIVIIENGVTTTSTGEFRERVSWKGNSGNGVVQVPGGSYSPIAERVNIGSNFLRVRKIFRGSAFHPESGEYYEIVGLSSLILTRRSSRNFIATASSRFAYGPLALVTHRSKGRKIR